MFVTDSDLATSSRLDLNCLLEGLLKKLSQWALFSAAFTAFISSSSITKLLLLSPVSKALPESNIFRTSVHDPLISDRSTSDLLSLPPFLCQNPLPWLLILHNF